MAVVYIENNGDLPKHLTFADVPMGALFEDRDGFQYVKTEFAESDFVDLGLDDADDLGYGFAFDFKEKKIYACSYDNEVAKIFEPKELAVK